MVKLINKKNDLVCSLTGFGKYSLNATDKLFARFRALCQRVEPQTENTLAPQAVRYVARCDLKRHATSNGVAVKIRFADNNRRLARCCQACNYSRYIRVVLRRNFQFAFQCLTRQVRSISRERRVNNL